MAEKMRVYVVPENDTKRSKAKAWLKNRWTDVSCWCSENKGLLMVAVPTVIGGITATVKVVGKNINLNKEQNLKEKFVYDTSLGHYWELRQKLTNGQWTEIERRRANGETLGQILNDMKVLK